MSNALLFVSIENGDDKLVAKAMHIAICLVCSYYQCGCKIVIPSEVNIKLLVDEKFPIGILSWLGLQSCHFNC